MRFGMVETFISVNIEIVIRRNTQEAEEAPLLRV